MRAENTTHFKHYKGTIYVKIGIVYQMNDVPENVSRTFEATHEGTLETHIVYETPEGYFTNLEDEYVLYFAEEKPGKFWLRVTPDFFGLIEHEGKTQPRFAPMD